MSKCHFNPRDLALRFDNTVVRIEGIPYIVRVDGQRFIATRLGNSRESISVDAYDDRVDISNFPLGYVQHGNSVIYTSRTPRRTARHGLTSDAVSYRGMPGWDTPIRGRTIFQSKGMEDCIMGNYPELEDAFNHLERTQEQIAIAISRDVAIAKTAKREVTEVFFKTDFVGWIAPGTKKVNVPSSRMSMVVSKYLSGYGYYWEVN